MFQNTIIKFLKLKKLRQKCNTDKTLFSVICDLLFREFVALTPTLYQTTTQFLILF